MMSQWQYEQRVSRLPEPIREIAVNNALVHRIVTQFGRGDICTLEEALCQMVLHLSNDWREEQKLAYDRMMTNLMQTLPSKGDPNER